MTKLTLKFDFNENSDWNWPAVVEGFRCFYSPLTMTWWTRILNCESLEKRLRSSSTDNLFISYTHCYNSTFSVQILKKWKKLTKVRAKQAKTTILAPKYTKNIWFTFFDNFGEFCAVCSRPFFKAGQRKSSAVRTNLLTNTL